MKRNQTLSMLLMLTATAGLAIAGPDKKPTSDQDTLRGPAVVDAERPQSPEEMKQHMEHEFAEHPLELRELAGAIRRMGNDRGDNTLNLSQEQRDQIKHIMQSYREGIKRFNQEHQAEIRKLRDQMQKDAQKLREQRREQAEKDKQAEENGMMHEERDQKAPPPVSEAAKKLRDMISEAPITKKTMKELTGVLSTEQMDEIHRAVFKMRTELRDRNQARGNRRGGPENARRGNPGDAISPGQRHDSNTRRNKGNKAGNGGKPDQDD